MSFNGNGETEVERYRERGNRRLFAIGPHIPLHESYVVMFRRDRPLLKAGNIAEEE